MCLQVVGFPDRVAANDFLLLNPNRVTAAVHLDVTAASNIGFTLQTNSTVCNLRLALLATHNTQRTLCLTKHRPCHVLVVSSVLRDSLEACTIFLTMLTRLYDVACYLQPGLPRNCIGLPLNMAPCLCLVLYLHIALHS